MRAKKSLGQNFLHDETVISRIIGALNLSSEETVVEIGPGLGALTGGLIARAGRIVAIEFDRDMVSILRVRFHGEANFELVNADALTVSFADYSIATEGSPAKLVANLPYNISTPILQRLIEQRMFFSEMVLMFQREVVDRIIAPAGGKERGFLSVLVEEAFETKYLFDVPPQAFRPVPKVRSSVIRLIPKPISDTDYRLFRRVVSVSFAQKRKTIFNNLKSLLPDAGAMLDGAGIEQKRRAETLTLEEWRLLTACIADSNSSLA